MQSISIISLPELTVNTDGCVYGYAHLSLIIGVTRDMNRSDASPSFPKYMK